MCSFTYAHHDLTGGVISLSEWKPWITFNCYQKCSLLSRNLGVYIYFTTVLVSSSNTTTSHRSVKLFIVTLWLQFSKVLVTKSLLGHDVSLRSWSLQTLSWHWYAKFILAGELQTVGNLQTTWHFHVEIEDYSVAYFNCILVFEVAELPWSLYVLRRAWISNESTKCIWALPLMEGQQYGTLNAVMRSK